mmetsp:Transcript_34745/g.75350  ORF Transcript_34745/g.75350 Transcript_34745/m.75350 type:complete len:255 (+) Transcript_34745:89-853(+)
MRPLFASADHVISAMRIIVCILLVAPYVASAFQPPSSQRNLLRYQQHRRLMSTTREAAAPASYGPAYCEKCGTPTKAQIPDGDERERSVCSNPECGHITYQNPKVVVGAVCTFKDEVLLCQRAIEPCAGKWGYPQGFLELGETTRQGAARETWEEAGVNFDATQAELLAIYNLAGMQVQMIYRVELENNEFEAGHESSDVKFVAWDDIPWDDLAFPTVNWGLEHARDMKGEEKPMVQERTKLVTMDGQWKVEEG